MTIRDLIKTTRYYLSSKDREFSREPNLPLDADGLKQWYHRSMHGETNKDWLSGSTSVMGCVDGLFSACPAGNTYWLEGKRVYRKYNSDMLRGTGKNPSKGLLYNPPFMLEATFEVNQDNYTIPAIWMLTKEYVRGGVKYITPEPDAFEVNKSGIFFSLHWGGYGDGHKMKTCKIYGRFHGKQRIQMYVYRNKVKWYFNGVWIRTVYHTFNEPLYPIITFPVVKDGLDYNWFKVYELGIYKI